MADFVLSERARKDLREIGDYTAEKLISQNKIRIVRILHEKMDFPRHL